MFNRVSSQAVLSIFYILANPPICNSVNVKDIFNSTSPRCIRSHHHTSPTIYDVSLNDLLPDIQKTLGMHHIHTKLYSLPPLKLNSLYNSYLESLLTNPNSHQYNLTASHRPFKHFFKKENTNKRFFLKLSFASEGLDVQATSSIMNRQILPILQTSLFQSLCIPT